MNRMLMIFLLAVVTQVVTVAQNTYVHTLPQGWEAVDGNYSPPGSTPFNTANSSRWQWTYDWTGVHHQFPMLITEIAFRRSVENTYSTSTYQGVTIRMSSCATDHLTMSGVFANNLDTDATVVFVGDVIIPNYTLVGVSPAPFNVRVILQTPFAFDPTKMKDLVIDMQVDGPTPATGGGFPLDGVFPSPYVSQNGHITNSLSTVNNWNNPDAGPIIELTYQAGTGFGTPFLDVTLFTSGGGAGDLIYQLDNLSLLPNIANVARGYTLISSTPAPSFGKGPLFGILPDALTWNLLLTQPIAPGNPFAFTVPGPFGGWPDVPVLLPPGAITLPSGTIWEVSVVLTNALGQIEAISPVRILNW